MQNDFKAIRQLFHISENNGFSEDEILTYKDVCEQLPKLLIQYYQQLGKYEFNQVQDNLLAPNQLRLSQNGEFLIFYQENQLACVWVIKVQDLPQNNPPVYISHDENFSTEKWQVEATTLSGFFNTMAYLQAVFGLPFYCEDFFSITQEELTFIEENFDKKPYRLNYWMNVEFYGNQVDEVIYVDKNANEILMAYACFNKSGFDKLDELLGGLGE